VKRQMPTASVLRLYTTLLLTLTLVACAGIRQEMVRGSGQLAQKEYPLGDITSVTLATMGDLTIELGDEERLLIEAEENLLPYFVADVNDGSLTIKTKPDANLSASQPINFYLTVKTLEKVVLASSGDVQVSDLKTGQFIAQLTSMGNLHMSDLEATKLDIEISGSGDLGAASLNVETLQATLSSMGGLHIGDLETQKLDVGIIGSGDLHVENLMAETLQATLSSMGGMVIDGGTVVEQVLTLSGSGDYKAPALKSTSAEVRLTAMGSATLQVRERLTAHTSGSGSVHYAGDPTVERTGEGMGKVKPIDQ